MVKASIEVADEIVRLLGGEKGLLRLGLHSLKEFEDGISAFVRGAASRGQVVDRAVIVVRKKGPYYALAIQTITPPIRFATYEVKAKHLKAAVRMKLWRRKG